jgi:hypothetical protein
LWRAPKAPRWVVLETERRSRIVFTGRAEVDQLTDTLSA